MFGFLRRGKRTREEPPAAPGAPPATLCVPGAPDFVYEDHIDRYEGYPYLRWRDVREWTDLLPEAERDAAWQACASGWWLHLAQGLGPAYRVTEGKAAAVIAPLEAAGSRELVALLNANSPFSG